MEDVYDEFGNLIPAELRVSNGTASTSGSSHVVANTQRSGQSNENSSQQKIIKKTFGDGEFDIPDPGPYQKRPYVESPKFADMLRTAEERRNKALANNLSEQERERRKGRYQAWTNFGQALGGLAGAGYAPVEKQDNRRALESYAKLDALRKEYDAIDSADNISWIQKLALQTQLQHDIQEQKAFDAREKERLNIQHWNQIADKTATGSITDTSGTKNKDFSSDSTTTQDTVYGSNKQTTGTTKVSKNPEWEAAEAAARNGAASQKPLTQIHSDNSYPINQSEGWDMIIQFRDLVDAINAGTKPVNGYYTTNKGVRIPAAGVDKELNELRNLITNIMGKYGQDEDANRTALEGLVKSIDNATGYVFRDYFNRQRGTGAAPAAATGGRTMPGVQTGANGGGKTMPGVNTGKTMPGVKAK